MFVYNFEKLLQTWKRVTIDCRNVNRMMILLFRNWWWLYVFYSFKYRCKVTFPLCWSLYNAGQSVSLFKFIALDLSLFKQCWIIYLEKLFWCHFCVSSNLFLQYVYNPPSNSLFYINHVSKLNEIVSSFWKLSFILLSTHLLFTPIIISNKTFNTHNLIPNYTNKGIFPPIHRVIILNTISKRRGRETPGQTNS